ncbi:hypothetical protein A1O7_08406 [Cladophialophora yegresii CBS 114405]|uniref:TIGR00297 family protein n=1 Tax=Cladophialophora yegresii CBS 114405 TaxID=1182544 RepID=W9WA87_9EURO|nr:uncharacterized protein A1O7_08406 [Cladophialophora yegresii CBS 114405]EXJ55479.1 hypothetical protein A1O7_08406 [Cladophialophora yegresii CBS 114405]
MRPIIAVPITLLLIIRSYTRRSLTIPGILTAALTATIHASHPSALPFTLLCVFFLLGTTATKVKHEVKAKLTLSSSGSSGGEGPRTSIQVLANSGCASILCAVHLWLYGGGDVPAWVSGGSKKANIPDVLLFGIMANYAAVTADTLSSELGILSKSQPVLITHPWRVVPKGTNGGVTLAGLLAGVGGGSAVAATSILFLTSAGSNLNIVGTFLVLTALGAIGTLLDSLFGAVLQASVVDRRTGKIIEGAGGVRVLVKSKSKPHTQSQEHARKDSGEESRLVNTGADILDNNQINLLMASIVSITGMAVGNLL